jgi:tetratricopeptide (TPR) repeat protein
VANSLYNLALLYYNQGQFEQAEPLFKRSMAIYEDALRPDHPKVLASFKNMAILYRKTGRIQKAEALEDKVAAIHHSEFNPENEITK